MLNVCRQSSKIFTSTLRLTPEVPQPTSQPVRRIWGWLNATFNSYDPSRVKEVGPDRAAAEWLIRCGAGVKWTRVTPAGLTSTTDPSLTSTEWFRDYNALPTTYDRELRISEIDGTDSAVMSHGFKYLQGLTHLHRIVFHKASYIEDDSLAKLEAVAGTLKELQVSSCGNVTVKGVQSLGKLQNLEQILLYDLPQVGAGARIECIQYLQAQLPKCHVEFPYAQASELKQQQLKKKDKDEDGDS